MISQLANKGVRIHLYPSLASTMSYLEEQKKSGSENKNQENWVGEEPLQTKIQIIKKMRRNKDPDAFLE